MIPLKLTLKGIYSYQTEQTIDFESLTKNHLFGIFGPVGSGKSAILEAISYAIYGETERLNTRDGRNYNMMNLKSNELLIDFTFKSGARNSEHYRFTVKGKRDKKDFSIVRTLDRAAYKLENASWVPIDCSTAEEIIGLSYDNFRRTIIIPQGQFQEFLQLGDADRTKMMKEIFNLGRYDLSARTDAVDKRNSAGLENVRGQLTQIGQVDQLMIDEELQKQQELVAKRHQLEKELQTIQISEKVLQDIKILAEKLQQHESELEKLLSRKAYNEQQDQLIEEYERCLKNFPDLLKQRRDLEKAIGKRQTQVASDTTAAAILMRQIQKAENELEVAKKEFENRHTLENRWKELESIVTLLGIVSELSGLEQQKSRLEKDLTARKQKLDSLNKEAKAAEAKAKALKKDLPDQKTLTAIKRWFEKRELLELKIEELKLSERESRSEVSSLNTDKKAFLQNETVIAHTTNSERQLPLSELIQLLKTKSKNCKALSTARQGEIDSLKKRESLEIFAAELKTGEACPLCGSEHHPHIYAGESVKTTINQLSKEIRKLDKESEKLLEAAQDLNEIRTKMDGLDKSLLKDTRELEAKTRDLKDHGKLFTWNKYEGKDPDWIDQELERFESITEEMDELDEQLSTTREDIETLGKEFETKKDSLQALSTQASDLNGRRKTMVGQLEHFTESELGQWTPASIGKEIGALKLSFQTVEQRYKDLDINIRTLKDEYGNLVGRIEADQKLLGQQTAEIGLLDQQLAERLKSSGIAELKLVEEILDKKLDVKKETEAVQDYYRKFASAQDHQAKLEKELGQKKYDPKAHAELNSQIETLKQSLRKTDQEIGLHGNRVQQLTEHLTKKTELESAQNKLEARKENLATLKKLFRGGGFVNYASRIYLESLCGIANQRFAQLTRQKLRLELNEDNAFEIRDFLNDGKLRSVKTLSGGQTFQASLCLALSLVDNLQQFARSEENFFFLDEGFGTLDKESLQIVFDALKSLRKDNRIVGVISHVEEMQQEIENYLSVELDPERGSVIIIN